MLKLVALVLLLGCGLPALADLSPDPAGEPQQIGSWVMPFLYANDTAFDKISVQMTTPGIVFSAGGNDGFGFFPSTGWSDTVAADKRSATAVGSSTNLLLFNLYFSSDLLEPLAFHFNVYSSNTLIQSGDATWHPGWTFSQSSTAVPEASTFMLRYGWLLLLAGVAFRRRRSAPSLA